MIGEELSKDRDVQIGDDGSVHAVDPSDGAFAEWSLEEGLGRFAGLQRQVRTVKKDRS